MNTSPLYRRSTLKTTRPSVCTGALTAGVVLLGLVAPRVASAASWQPVGSLSEPRDSATATVLTDGTVLVTGGEGYRRGNFVWIESVERFDPKTNTFTVQRPMSVARGRHAAVRLQDGRVLLVGGFDDKDRALASAEVFDPVTGTFSRVGDMTIARGNIAATLLPDGRVLVMGGASALATDKTLATAELFDPTAGKFQATGALAGPRANHLAVALPDGRVVILGGFDGNGEIVRRVEIYDPTSGTFSAQGEIATDRAPATANLLPDGKILLAGGVKWDPTGSGTIHNGVEIYDPATGQSKITGTLASPRFGHVAVALADGRVLLAGGWTALKPTPKPVRLAELVDPTSGQLSATEPMTVERAQPTGVLLPDGRVLVMGGARRFGSGGLVATAEVYVP